MDSLSLEPQGSSTVLQPKTSGLLNTDNSPCPCPPSDENSSYSSPKAPNSNKFEKTEEQQSKSVHSSKIQTIIESLVGENQKDKSDKLDEIDSYITKLLDKLKVERQRISDIESTRASLKSLAENASDRSEEQENLRPQESAETVESDLKSSSPSSTRGARVVKEVLKETGKERTAAQSLMDPFKSQKYTIQDILKISTQRMDFGVVMPGKIVEETLDITNKSTEDIVVQICLDCLNPELNDTEEYIYSIRRSHLYDYNDKHYLLMSPNSSASFKITLKTPNIRHLNEILGETKIAVRGVKGLYKIGLYSTVTIPRVICTKELYNAETNCRIIKLAIKQGKKLESKFPLKNTSNVPVTLDLSFFQPKNVEEDPKFQCLLSPNVINIPAQGAALVNLSLKSVKSMMRIDVDDQRSFKKILIGTTRNSTLIYSFLLWIDIC